MSKNDIPTFKNRINFEVFHAVGNPPQISFRNSFFNEMYINFGGCHFCLHIWVAAEAATLFLFFFLSEQILVSLLQIAQAVVINIF
jgi:hypothetical protein